MQRNEVWETNFLWLLHPNPVHIYLDARSVEFLAIDSHVNIDISKAAVALVFQLVSPDGNTLLPSFKLKLGFCWVWVLSTSSLGKIIYCLYTQIGGPPGGPSYRIHIAVTSLALGRGKEQGTLLKCITSAHLMLTGRVPSSGNAHSWPYDAFQHTLYRHFAKVASGVTLSRWPWRAKINKYLVSIPGLKQHEGHNNSLVSSPPSLLSLNLLPQHSDHQGHPRTLGPRPCCHCAGECSPVAVWPVLQPSQILLLSPDWTEVLLQEPRLPGPFHRVVWLQRSLREYLLQQPCLCWSWVTTPCFQALLSSPLQFCELLFAIYV